MLHRQRQFCQWSSISIRRRVHSWCEQLHASVSGQQSDWKEKLSSADLNRMRKLLDFTKPWEWWSSSPLAHPSSRNKRIIKCHVGPTNSGKTYQAIQHLLKASSGIYCAPLRLLAVEMWQKMTSLPDQLQFHSQLVTGEVQISHTPNSTSNNEKFHTYCTVEMADLSQSYDVAIIDEIQMLADVSRGWAFTQAFLGLDASTIYCCGEAAIVPILKQLVDLTGDDLQVIEHDRLSPLTVQKKTITNIKQLEPGDCLVCFSRKDIFHMRALVQRSNPHLKVTVVYGRLPMDNRASQARVFNDQKNAVMIASDAIGMGLNLNIKRVVFTEVTKFASRELGMQSVSMHQIKQIAGRAGRFSTNNEEGGFVTTLGSSRDLNYVRSAISRCNANYKFAGLQPPPLLIHRYLQCFPHLSLLDMIHAMEQLSRTIRPFHLQFSDDQKCLLLILEELKSLSVAEKLVLCTAPVSIRMADTDLVLAFRTFAAHLASRSKQPCPLPAVTYSTNSTTRPISPYSPYWQSQLQSLENAHRALDLYLWLGTRFPMVFSLKQQANDEKLQISTLISKLLDL